MDDVIGSGAYSVGSNYSDGLDSINNRISDMKSSPDFQIQTAINHLNDANSGMDFQTRMHLVEPLLRAQHFGQGGGLDGGQGLLYPNPGQSQGQIKPGKAGGDSKAGGIAGMISSIAALL